MYKKYMKKQIFIFISAERFNTPPFKAGLLILTTLIFSGCISIKKNISIESNNIQTEMNLKKVETTLVPLEASAETNSRTRQNEISSARRMITSLEKEASADADYSAKLTAWSGRLSLLENRYSEAQRLFRQSTAASPGNIPSIILGLRLEGDLSRRLENIDRELINAGVSLPGRSAAGYGELQIERGRCLFELKRFSEAAGAFDTAFSSGLDNIYSVSYRADRERAWELRNTGNVNAGTINTLRQENINWDDCITITKNETQLLRFLTGGRDVQNIELFNRLVDRAFIPYVQDISINEWPDRKPNLNAIITRAGAAWFVWHLYAEARADRGMLTRYSTRYATGVNLRSPVPDIPLLSPFFDSILGSVETELMSLPDGRNFIPAQEIRSSELLAMLRKIDN
jgi:tetratricopeptide (TPR) repeat protein